MTTTRQLDYQRAAETLIKDYDPWPHAPPRSTHGQRRAALERIANGQAVVVEDGRDGEPTAEESLRWIVEAVSRQMAHAGRVHRLDARELARMAVLRRSIEEASS
jgi:hypothetical protein